VPAPVTPQIVAFSFVGTGDDPAPLIEVPSMSEGAQAWERACPTLSLEFSLFNLFGFLLSNPNLSELNSLSLYGDHGGARDIFWVLSCVFFLWSTLQDYLFMGSSPLLVPSPPGAIGRSLPEPPHRSFLPPRSLFFDFSPAHRGLACSHFTWLLLCFLRESTFFSISRVAQLLSCFPHTQVSQISLLVASMFCFISAIDSPEIGSPPRCPAEISEIHVLTYQSFFAPSSVPRNSHY